MQRIVNFAFFVFGGLLSFLFFSKQAEVAPSQPSAAVPIGGAVLDSGHTFGGRIGFPEEHPKDTVPAEGLASARQPVVVDAEAWSRTDAAKGFVGSLVRDLGPGWGTPPNPNAEASGPLVGGVRNGPWSVFWPEKGWTERGNYVLGARHGEWEMYDSSGELIRVYHYYGGKLDGEMKDRNSPSGTWTTYYYRDGKIVMPSELAIR